MEFILSLSCENTISSSTDFTIVPPLSSSSKSDLISSSASRIRLLTRLFELVFAQ